MATETALNDSLEGQPEEFEGYREVFPDVNLSDSHGVRAGAEGNRLGEQVRALKEQLRVLKEVILESSDDFINPDEGPSQILPRNLQRPVFDRQILSEVTSKRDSYFLRVQNLEERVGRLLPSGLGGDGSFQDLVDQRSVAVVDPDLYYETHREGGYLSQLQRETLRKGNGHESTESEILARLDAAKAERIMAEADRDTLIDENEDLREKLKTILLRYEALVQQWKSVQSGSSGQETCVDSSENRNVDMADVDIGDEAVGRMEMGELHTSQNPHTIHPDPSTRDGEVCEAQLILVRSERDAAIKRNEEARRTLATRTAERNGAHQRIRILEASLTESQEREAKLQAEIRRKESQERTSTSLLDTETSTEGAERKDVEFLQEELEHAVAAASKAQRERDAARIEIKVMEAENAIAHSAAETANDVVTELQVSLEAANNAALAEREKSEERRRTQNRLRVERETLRIKVAKLERALSEAHQVSIGLVRHGNITVGDLVHVREERDSALARLETLQAELDQATGTVTELQIALDDLLATHANGPTDDLALDELNRVIVQRDEALSHVKELERLLEELEEDYRTNLDQWERQTQRDEKEIIDSRDRLNEEMTRSTDLSDQLKAANIKLEEAEIKALTAEARSTTLDIQAQQIAQDLDHSNEDREGLETACELLRAECLRLGGMIVAVRNEVICLGGRIVAPDGTVQGEDGWPDGPPLADHSDSDIPRRPAAKPQPVQEDLDVEDNDPVPYPRKRGASTRRQPRKASSAYELSDSDLSSIESNLLIPEEWDLQWRPRQRPARRSDSTPLLRTSPTISTQTHPRSSRNPAPYYGTSTRSRPVKRRADTDREKPGSGKKQKQSKS
ncbi:hypothetical protein BKA64DRAFT_712940 [Cadophora sp. MPI-SDFR-AT-0126]|nr:hypothetical protein BKA64DRAFT_712940 [Leotiomycetes sp. MPI-SDFR-AT-0126]